MSGRKLFGKLIDGINALKSDPEPEEEPAYFCFNEENPETEPGRLWIVTLSAPLTYLQNNFMDSFEIRMSAGECIKSLYNSWDIVSPETARDTLQNLTLRGHRALFPFVMHLVQNVEVSKWPEEAEPFVLALDSETPQHTYDRTISMAFNLHEVTSSLQEDYDIGPIELQRGIQAWDATRAVSLARSCRQAGYLEVNEAWEVCMPFVMTARQSYSNWEQYLQGFIIGRAVWAGLGDHYDELAALNYVFTESSKSPFKNIPWDDS